MPISTQRASLTRDPCAGCGKRPSDDNVYRLWMTVLNDRGERIINLCEDCASRAATSYLDQLARVQRAYGNPPPFMLKPTEDRRRRRVGG